MNKIIITTVGTSLFTNFLSKEFQEFLIGDLKENKWSDTLKNDIERFDFNPTTNDKKELNKLDKIIYGVKRTKIDNQIIYERTNCQEINIDASAEIKSICRIADGQEAEVYLLATDTFMSEFAAEKIREVFNKREELKITVKEVKRIKNLSIDNVTKFEETGFKKIIDEIDAIATDENGKMKDNVILNISGGYKALIPFLTIYAQLKGLPIAYIYEDSEEVIYIGGHLLNFNVEDYEVLYPLLDKNFLKLRNKNSEEIKTYDRLKEKYLIDENGEKTILGKILEKEAEQKLQLTKGTLGTIVELKLYEFYNNFKEITDNWKILRSKHIASETEKAEIDLFFVNKENDSVKKFFEIKSFRKVIKNINSVFDDIEKRFRIAQEKKWIIDEYVFIIYKAKFHRIDFLKNKLLYRYNNLDTEMKDKVKFKFIEIDTYPDFLGYNMDGFLHGELKNEEIKKINL